VTARPSIEEVLDDFLAAVAVNDAPLVDQPDNESPPIPLYSGVGKLRKAHTGFEPVPPP
jgi:hypothetical protein